MTASSGMAAPTEKLAADVKLLEIGRALSVSEIPSSSRACAPSASWAISCSATFVASAGSTPRRHSGPADQWLNRLA